MSSGAKLKLKAIQKAIKAEEWQDAVDLSKEVLKEEKGQGQNVYNALVFAGLAFTKLEKFDDAEKVLSEATKLYPDLPLAYQGLTKLFTDRNEWEKLCDLVQQLVIQAVERQDSEECAKHLQRLIDLRIEHGDRYQVDAVLSLLLPTSPIYNILSALPQPESTTTNQESASYTPWTPPSYPAPPAFSELPLSSALPIPSLEATADLPSPLPPITQLVHNPQTSLALLLTLAQREELRERTKEEKEVEKRRTRLGAGGEREVRRTVGRETMAQSMLPGYYEEISAHPASPDEVRRAAESRLLRHWYRLMSSLSRTPVEEKPPKTTSPAFPANIFLERTKQPLPSKQEAREKVEDMAKGMVLLQIEDETAWNLALEWKDAGGLNEYELSFLHGYLTLFPLSSTSALITGYLRYFGLPEPGEEERKKAARRRRRELEKRAKKGKKVVQDLHVEEGEEAGAEDENARREPFALMVDTLDSLPKSLFAHKVVGEAYQREEDWAATISTAEKGKDVVRGMEIEVGSKMPASRAVLDVLLGTALVHFYPPKHHPRALQLLDGVLKLDENAIPCFMGRGYIYQFEARFEEARAEFAKIVELEAHSRSGSESPMGKIELQAKEEVGWCLVKEGRLEEGQAMIKEVVETLESTSGKAVDVARCWWRVGSAEWVLGPDHRDQALDYWVQSLRCHPIYAPAFTSMGIWYLEHASPPDAERASKCFQKAFELDATEAEAARRLAEGYAAETEWALVDVVAKRVMEGEGGIEGGLSGKEHGSAPQKFLPTNAWAWKAAGAVQMAYKKYNEAAQSFQVALRAEKEDVYLWTRLGEAYAKSGRHVAALKALREALRLDAEHWVGLYHIGNVEREMGQFEQAIASYSKILERRDEPGVVLALSEAYLALGTQAMESGLRQRGFQAYLRCLEQIGKIIQNKKHRLSSWRAFANGCVRAFGCILETGLAQEVLEVIKPVLQHLSEVDDQHAADVEGVVKLKDLLKDDWLITDVIKAGISAFAYRSSLLKFDTRVPEPPLYDLAVSLHEYGNAIADDPSKSGELQAATRAAVLAIKQALETDPAAPALWNTFGTVAARGSKQLAQHAFVIALELEPRNASTWCNLGFLCLDGGDIELADQAFVKAQILEPENPLPWTGQALVAHAQFQPQKAESYFDQAVTLSSGSEMSAALGLAHLAFQPFLRTSGISAVALHGPAFALKRYCEANPRDSSALTLLSLVQERLGQFDASVGNLKLAVTYLEGEYEHAESPEVADKYAVALLNLGRLYLAQGSADSAIEMFGDCQGLLGEATDERSTSSKVQCLLGCALALIILERLDEGLERFQQALDVAAGLGGSVGMVKETIAVYLARALWMLGDEEAREMAKTQLLESLSSADHSARALATTIAVGVMTEDEGVVEAVLAEASENKGEDREGVLQRALALQALTMGDISQAKSIVSKAVQAHPDTAKLWTGLVELLGDDVESWTVHALLDPAQLRENFMKAAQAAGVKISIDEEEEPEEVGEESGVGPEAIKQAQKAVMLEPWERRHWTALALATTAVV